MKYERMLTFTTKYDRHNARCMGHLILKETDDPQAVMANHRLAKQIESYEVSPLLPHAHCKQNDTHHFRDDPCDREISEFHLIILS